MDVFFVFGFGEAPIDDDGFAEFSDHDVGGFDISVYAVAAVRVGDGLAQIDEVGEEFEAFCERARILDRLGEALAEDEFHGVVGRAVFAQAEFVDGGDAGVFELAGDFGFLEEAGQHGSGSADRGDGGWLVGGCVVWRFR